MDLDYKTLVVFAALALSVYNFFYSRRIRALEKRSAVMAELTQVQLLWSQLALVFTELDQIDFRESLISQRVI